MKKICWPGWISAVAMVAFVLLASGCQSSESLVPRDISQQVNEDGREWTYDTAWQNIRALNADIAAGDISTIDSQALLIASQMERLEKGKASSLSSSTYARILEAERHKAEERTEEENLQELIILARAIQESFDDGDFESAKNQAIAFYGLAQSFSNLARPEGFEPPTF